MSHDNYPSGYCVSCLRTTENCTCQLIPDIDGGFCSECKEWIKIDELEINNGYCEQCVQDLSK